MAEPSFFRYGSQILNITYKSQGVSRAELAEKLVLDKATVTRIVGQLIQKGYLIQGFGDETWESKHAGRIGRKRVPLHIPESCGCAMGLEVQEDCIKIGLVSPSGKLLYSEIIESPWPLPLNTCGIDRAEKLLISGIRAAEELGKEEASRLGLRLLGIGIALTGLVDVAKGCLCFSIGLGVLGKPLSLKGPLVELLRVPVMLDNDAKCCCYDTLTFSVPPVEKDFLYIFCELPKDPKDSTRYVRISLGMALVLGGAVQYGSRYAAGEFRSVFSNSQVPGQFGCFTAEQYCLIRSNATLRHRFIHELTSNIAFIANFLDIQAVHMGGGIEVYGEELQHALDKAVASLWLYQKYLPRQLPIRFAENEEKPAVRGAAAMVLRRIFIDKLSASGEPWGLEYLEALGHGEG